MGNRTSGSPEARKPGSPEARKPGSPEARKPPLDAKAIQRSILDEIRGRLRGRTWSWLAQASGVPQATLSRQASKPKFTIETLCAIAEAFDTDLEELLHTAQDGVDQ